MGASCQDGVEGYLEVQGEVAVVAVPEEEGQEADLGVDLEVKGGAGALRVLALQAVSGTEELLDVVQEEGLQVVQVAVKVEQVVVQAEVVLAWGVLVSEMEEQTVEGLAAGKLQTCHQREIPPYAVSVIAFLLQNHLNLHHRPLKIPRLRVPLQGFPDLKEIRNQTNEADSYFTACEIAMPITHAQ